MRIAVQASGIHRVDIEVRSGRQLGPFPLPELPYILGREVAGIVDAVADDVTRELIGTRVAVSLGNANGGYARLAVAAAADLHDIGPDLDARVAVAMVGTGRTAKGMLANAQLTSADTVLITGAAGGLGSLFVQATHRLGATIVAVAGGPDRAALATSLGADVAVDHTDPSWIGRVRTLAPTVLLDGSGGAVGAEAARLLRPGSRALFFGHPTGVSDDELARRSITTTPMLGPPGGFTPDNSRRWAAEAIADAVAGTLRPQLTTFALAEAARAHAEFQRRTTVGKVVLV